MTSLPTISGREAPDALIKDGWTFARQRGSHMILVKSGHIASLSVPDHKELAKGTLRGLLRSAGMTPDRFSLCCHSSHFFMITLESPLDTKEPCIRNT